VGQSNEGRVIAECLPRHRHQEWLAFLKKIDAETSAELDLHLIVDNYATHKHPKVKSWLKRHKRFHLHFIPTSSSWLNVIERWFRDITVRRIRRGTFRSVKQLKAAIEDDINCQNKAPKPFVWTAKAGFAQKPASAQKLDCQNWSAQKPLMKPPGR
jgi:transposase